MGNVSQMCEATPPPMEEHIHQNQTKLKADILEVFVISIRVDRKSKSFLPYPLKLVTKSFPR